MHTSRNVRRSLFAVGAALALTLVAPAVASASSQVEKTAAPQHCVTHVDTGIVACTGDGVTLEQARATAAGARSAEGAAAPARAAQRAVHVATIYSGFLGQGSSLEINASGNCTSTTSDVNWQLGNVGSAMNDKTSSVRVFAGCRVQLYDAANCPAGGARFPASGWAGTTNYVGDAMNDRTTCVRGT